MGNPEKGLIKWQPDSNGQPKVEILPAIAISDSEDAILALEVIYTLFDAFRRSPASANIDPGSLNDFLKNMSNSRMFMGFTDWTDRNGKPIKPPLLPSPAEQEKFYAQVGGYAFTHLFKMDAIASEASTANSSKHYWVVMRSGVIRCPGNIILDQRLIGPFLPSIKMMRYRQHLRSQPQKSGCSRSPDGQYAAEYIASKHSFEAIAAELLSSGIHNTYLLSLFPKK